MKMKEETDERRSVLDWLVLNLYNAVNQLKLHAEELEMLKYKEGLENDKKLQEEYEQQNNRPIPPMKVVKIPKPEDLQNQFFLPTHHPKCLHCSSENERKELISKVWQPNSNQPTMTLDEVADMEMENLR